MGGIVTQGSSVGIPAENRAVITSTVDLFDTDGFNIGFITQITAAHARNVQRLRHLNSADAGRVIESAPSPEDINLSATGFNLYDKTAEDKQSLISRLPGRAGARFKTLNDQKDAFLLKILETHPTSGLTNQSTYLGCWMTSYNRPINIAGATIAASGNISVENII